MLPKTKICENCLFYLPIENQPNRMGYCHFNPPQFYLAPFLTENGEQRLELKTGFSETRPDWQCGQWQPDRSKKVKPLAEPPAVWDRRRKKK